MHAGAGHEHLHPFLRLFLGPAGQALGSASFPAPPPWDRTDRRPRPARHGPGAVGAPRLAWRDAGRALPGKRVGIVARSHRRLGQRRHVGRIVSARRASAAAFAAAVRRLRPARPAGCSAGAAACCSRIPGSGGRLVRPRDLLLIGKRPGGWRAVRPLDDGAGEAHDHVDRATGDGADDQQRNNQPFDGRISPSPAALAAKKAATACHIAEPLSVC